MPDRSQFISSLEQQVRVYKGYLEGMFGLCDKRFVFRRIEKSTLQSGGPQTPYAGDPGPNGHRDIDIQISKDAWDNCDYYLGAWDVAHEAVHLLDPVPCGVATFLEEGLGAWFQDQPRYHVPYLVPSMKDYVVKTAEDRPADNYTKAKELVCEYMPELIPVVKELRSPTVKISDIDAGMLASGLRRAGRADINGAALEHLCTKFHN